MRRSVIATVLLSSSVVQADIDCGGGASCPSGNTCCRNGSGGFSCCPVVDATCCSDYVHCCPPEHPVCDLSTGSCTARSMASMLAEKKRVPWLTKTPASIKKPAVEKSINNGTTAAAASGDADCGVSGFCYQITNPQSPLGSQHCQELDNPGGKASKYWADRGWKYTSPPWKNGTCDRNQFNYVNKVTHNLDGYDGVTFWYLGIQK
eukprot:g639.t1